MSPLDLPTGYQQAFVQLEHHLTSEHGKLSYQGLVSFYDTENHRFGLLAWPQPKPSEVSNWTALMKELLIPKFAHTGHSLMFWDDMEASTISESYIMRDIKKKGYHRGFVVSYTRRAELYMCALMIGHYEPHSIVLLQDILPSLLIFFDAGIRCLKHKNTLSADDC